MDKVKLEKVFNPLVLFFANLAIIVISEITGQLFFRLGIMHIIAILFMILLIVRIFVRYYSYDPILEKFFLVSLTALFVFIISHIIEFASVKMAMNHVAYSPDSALINTVNFYLICLMFAVIGADAFLRIYDRRSAAQIDFLIGLVVVIAILILMVITNNGIVSFGLKTWTPYLYAVIVVIFGSVALIKVSRIGKYVGIFFTFTKFTSAAIIFLVFSALTYIFYNLLQTNIGIQFYQIIYLSHFFFYASSSMFFLAFGRVKISGGIYDDLKKIDQKI